jgi:hypothetical protein
LKSSSSTHFSLLCIRIYQVCIWTPCFCSINWIIHFWNMFGICSNMLVNGFWLYPKWIKERKNTNLLLLLP